MGPLPLLVTSLSAQLQIDLSRIQSKYLSQKAIHYSTTPIMYGSKAAVDWWHALLQRNSEAAAACYLLGSIRCSLPRKKG